MGDRLIQKFFDYFARRNLGRLAVRGTIVAVIVYMAAWVQTPEGQLALVAVLGSYAWAAPVITLLILAIASITNGKEKTP